MKFNHNLQILSLTEKIFLNHIINSNKKISNLLKMIKNETYVLSREYTGCGMYVYLDTFDFEVNNLEKLPEFLFGDYVSINNEVDADFILYTNKSNKFKTLEIVSVNFSFNELEIANFLFDKIINK